jgi:hypothetical protein
MSVLPRREFLRLVAATAVSLGLDPLRGVSVDNDIYRNDRLGLQLRRPRGWEFESVADFVALREHKVLQDALQGEPHPLRDPTNLPVFAIFDPAHRRGDFAPAVCLYDEPLDHPVPRDEARAHRDNMLGGFAVSFREFRVLSAPRPLSLTGTRATESVWRYLHELDDGRSWHLLARSVVVFRPPRVHTFHLVDSADTPFVRSSTFDRFLGTIAYRSNSRLPSPTS